VTERIKAWAGDGGVRLIGRLLDVRSKIEESVGDCEPKISAKY
jgi:hypothetical protein